MDYEKLDKVIHLMRLFVPIMHRKILREIFRVSLNEIGAGIAPHHLIILNALRDADSLHLGEIAEETGISRPHMSQSTDKLVALGLIEREPDTTDRRKVNIRLTEMGRTTLERLDEIIRGRERERLSQLSDHDLERLAGSLTAMVEIIAKLQ